MLQGAFLCSLTKAVQPVSHFKERKETNCLNCNAEVAGRYCYVCGQENTPPKQTTGHLISHFFNDVTHFDGKFFSTIGTLISRPGLLTTEYVRGRKMSYVDPAKMYIFTSAIFFIVFFSLFNFDEKIVIPTSVTNLQEVARMNDAELHKYTFKKYEDSTMPRQVALQRAAEKDTADSVKGVSVFGTSYRHYEAYENAQHQLPASRRDNFIKHYFIQKVFLIVSALKKDTGNFIKKVGVNILHRLPQMMFVSLPLFALLLKLLYYRRKQFYYTDHGIFSIHLYIFSFINLIVFFALERLQINTHWKFIGLLQGFLLIWIFIYLYKAMRLFYGQRRGKTLSKFLLLNLMALFLMVILFSAFAIFSSFSAV